MSEYLVCMNVCVLDFYICVLMLYDPKPLCLLPAEGDVGFPEFRSLVKAVRDFNH